MVYSSPLGKIEMRSQNIGQLLQCKNCGITDTLFVFRLRSFSTSLIRMVMALRDYGILTEIPASALQ